MGAENLIRCYYIGNDHDRSYFVLTDCPLEYSRRMTTYMKHLVESGKLNYYIFGSIELTESQYLSRRRDVDSYAKEVSADNVQKKSATVLTLVPNNDDAH